ncbi:hypothetical protein [Nonomuraea insulae]|uniref:Tyr recombinase domain-containing protein n=1 Tax=Nonomuraea insulae TaxID=1616787 RepID=A0ABW1CR73_9ACTN
MINVLALQKAPAEIMTRRQRKIDATTRRSYCDQAGLADRFQPGSGGRTSDADRPKALVWTDERVAAWNRDLQGRLDVEQRRREARLSRASMINVYASVPRPSPVTVWTPSHTFAFLAQAATHRLLALYRLIALRGLRWGEAVGLRWKDVDLAAGISVLNRGRVRLPVSHDAPRNTLGGARGASGCRSAAQRAQASPLVGRTRGLSLPALASHVTTVAAMSDTPRRPKIQWQDDSEHLKNRDAARRIVSEAPRPSEPEMPRRAGATDAEEGSGCP